MQRHPIIRLLAVEDEAPHRELLGEIFDDAARYHLTFASHGPQAIDLLARQPFDVVLMDNNMPGLTGQEVCRQVRQEPGLALLPIIMVTALNSSQDLARCLAAGADDFVGKPYSPVELIARVNAAAQRKWFTDQLDNAESILFALAHMVEARDLTTGRHCARLAHVSQVFATSLGLDRETHHALRRGAILHDIGKLVVPDAILNKNGTLAPEEWAVMQRHPVIGTELCANLASMSDALPIIRHHHEQFSGGGYPDGLSGEAIPLPARLFQIIDIFDALHNKRPYKEALPLEQVTAILTQERERGRTDPRLTHAFLDLVHQEPRCLALPETPDSGESLYNRLLSQGLLQGSRFEPMSNGSPP